MADFDAPKLLLVALAVFELPGRTLRLCDGGFVYWGANKFSGADVDFGAIQSVDPVDERSGDEAPGGRLTFLPASGAAAATLSNPEYQGAPVRFYFARVNEATGLIMGDPELVFDGELDTTTLRVGRGTRALDMEFISVAERLFNVYEGNVLSPRFHKSVWSGELGLDNATGVTVTVAWGVEPPPRSSTFSNQGGGQFAGQGSGAPSGGSSGGGGASSWLSQQT